MIAIKGKEIPKGCQHCIYFRKHLFGNGLDYSYSCVLGATEFPMPWIRQMEERASDCPLVEIVTCKDCKYRDPEDKFCDCGHTIRWSGPREDIFYCADAERSETKQGLANADQETMMPAT